MKILLIEDEESLSDAIRSYLIQSDFLCEAAATVADAEEKIDLYEYDVVLVDINLPDGSGLQLIELLKKARSRSGIMIISARNSLDDKIEGLNLGADDYITKPFHMAELNARIRSVVRRRQFEGHSEIVFNEIRIDTDTTDVFVNTERVELTGKEYKLLLYLIANQNRVVTKEAIAEHLWGDHIDMVDSFDFIYTHIKNMRKKVLAKCSADYLQTIYGMGYKLSSA
ncbi:MAG: response regulator transcription factor [Calditrichota bacterium]|mgnify:CR=1 FL=1